MTEAAFSPSLTNDQIEDIIGREIGFSFFAAGMELLGVLDLDWGTVSPDVDPLPDDRLAYADATSMHVLIAARCLALNNDEFVVTKDFFLYTLQSLAEAGEGPSATPDSYIDVAWDPVDLQAEIAPELSELLVRVAEALPSDALATLLASQDDATVFISEIKDAAIRHAFAQLWEIQNRSQRSGRP